MTPAVPHRSPVTLSMKNRWSRTAQVGVDVPFNDKCSLDVPQPICI